MTDGTMLFGQCDKRSDAEIAHDQFKGVISPNLLP